MIIEQLLSTKCVFCGYSGSGYYQEHTHEKDCPWYYVGGLEERENQLPVILRELYRKTQESKEG
jgi:hypothetical protein